MQLRRVRERPEPHVSGGATGPRQGNGKSCGLQECMFRFQFSEVLLHWELWKSSILQADGLFQDIQGGLSQGIFLCL